MIKRIIMLNVKVSHPMMNGLIPLPRARLPALITGADERASRRYIEFFTAVIRNPHTRKAYLTAVDRFTAWCAGRGLDDLAVLQPVHVTTYIEGLQAELAPPSVKQHLAAIKSLLDYLATGGVLPFNPAAAVRGPRHSVKRAKTPVLTAEETRTLLDSINDANSMRFSQAVSNARDRALIGVMVYTFARVGAVLAMRVDDCFAQGRRMRVRFHKKGGKEHVMPCHHTLERYLDEYLRIGGLPAMPTAPLFQSSRSGSLTGRGLGQPDVWRMLRRRAETAGIATKIGAHTFRATGITEYLKNGGKLELAQQMANHASPHTTSLYDRRNDQVSLDEVERIFI
jgi:site-specific recombinase XerD